MFGSPKIRAPLKRQMQVFPSMLPLETGLKRDKGGLIKYLLSSLSFFLCLSVCLACLCVCLCVLSLIQRQKKYEMVLFSVGTKEPEKEIRNQ